MNGDIRQKNLKKKPVWISKQDKSSKHTTVETLLISDNGSKTAHKA